METKHRTANIKDKTISTIEYKTIKDFKEDELKALFLSVDWLSGKYPAMLAEAMRNSTHVFSAWSDDMLVGLARCMSDGVWQAKLDCMVVHPDHQGFGIATKFLEKVKEACRNVFYLEVNPDEPDNVEFYEQRGFSLCADTATLKIVTKPTEEKEDSDTLKKSEKKDADLSEKSEREA